jgi:hypothetical protein
MPRSFSGLLLDQLGHPQNDRYRIVKLRCTIDYRDCPSLVRLRLHISSQAMLAAE